MAKKKGHGFWIGVLLLIFGILNYINLGVVSRFTNQIAPILMIVAGIYFIIKY